MKKVTVSLQSELANTSPERIEANNVSKSFTTDRGKVLALDRVSVKVGEGEFLCLVGPSGCGKSTLLNLIAGIDQPDSGQILANGENITGPGRDRMVMFQEHALFPWLDVMGNVLFGLRLKPGLNSKERREVAKYYLHLVGLEKSERANIHELSGGMKQRVAIARALAGDIQRIWEARRKTIIFVTHNVREAACLGDRVLLFSPNPGRIRAEFRIELPRPRDINSVELARYSTEITTALKGFTSAQGKEVSE